MSEHELRPFPPKDVDEFGFECDYVGDKLYDAYDAAVERLQLAVELLREVNYDMPKEWCRKCDRLLSSLPEGWR